VRVHSDQGRHLVRTPLVTLEARLDPRDFVRVHRGAIVNRQKVVQMREANGLSVVLHDGTEVPVSRSRRAAVESVLRPARRPAEDRRRVRALDRLVEPNRETT
jgi:two-component system LytT family response regulator